MIADSARCTLAALYFSESEAVDPRYPMMLLELLLVLPNQRPRSEVPLVPVMGTSEAPILRAPTLAAALTKAARINIQKRTE